MISEFQVNDIVKCIDSTDTNSHNEQLSTGAYYVVNRVFKGQVWGLFHSLSVTQLGEARSIGIYQAKRFVKVVHKDIPTSVLLDSKKNPKHEKLVQHLTEKSNR